MANIKLRPDASTAVAGFDNANPHLVWGDNNNSTYSTQNESIANATLSFDTLPTTDGIPDPTSATIYVVAGIGRGGSVELALKWTLGTTVINETLEINLEQEEVRTSAYSGAGLTRDNVDNMTLLVQPDTTGVTIFEIWIDTDYTTVAPSTVGTVILADGFVELTAGELSL